MSLTYLSNFWRTLEMPLINGEITLDLTYSVNCVIYKVDWATTFEITNLKHHVPAATLSTQGNA